MLIEIYLLLLFIFIKSSLSTTSIKTYPTVNLTENVPINTNVIELINEENIEMRKLKLILLNLGGFETNYFEIKNENILTKNIIDREQFLGEKRCFDRFYCLIELHILVNDGEQYWVIPIHIIDENDNKPQFKNSSIELKFIENDLNGYKMLFEGAIDYDEGINNKISYILDCSKEKKEINLIIKEEEEKSLINCFPLFELIIFSQSSLLINQYDQLGLKYNPSSSLILENEYELILYAFNINKKDFINSMIINVKINKILKKPKFILNENKLIIKEIKKGLKIGQINAISNDLTQKLIYKIINQTNKNAIEINLLTGELFILNENKNLINLNKINILIECSYLNNKNLKSFVNIEILIRLLNKLNNILVINYQFNLTFIKQINNSNEFIIFSENNISLSLLNLSINSINYPSDQLILSLLNYNSIFKLNSLSSTLNNYSLQLNDNKNLNKIYLLIIEIKHQLTNEYLSNLTIKISFQSSILCLKDSIFYFYNFNKTNLIGKFQIIETNLNISSFDHFILFNKNQIHFNQCQMLIIQLNSNFTDYQYQLCSNLSNQCFYISLINKFSLKKFFSFQTIQFISFILSITFILSMITFIFIIYRLKAFHLCLTIKNYLFYGKKYGLNNAQRISTNKINQRIHSIVVRESQSPSIEHIKSIEPYIFNLNQFNEQETIPSIHLYSQTNSSSIQREQRTISNVENEIISQTSPSILQETKQLLDIIKSNQDLDLSKLASEV